MRKSNYLQWTALILPLLFFTLSSCVMPPQKTRTAIDSIHRTLQKDIDNDRLLASHGFRQNEAMNAALLQANKLHLSSFQNPQERKFDVSVNNAPAKSFFMGLVAGTPYNMAVGPDVSGAVSLKLKNVTIEQTLQAVQDIYGYSFQKTSYGFQVMPPSLQTQIFTLNYLDVERTGRSSVYLSSTSLSANTAAISSGASTGGGASSGAAGAGSSENTKDSGAQVTTVFKNNFWTNLQTTLTAMIGIEQGRSVTVNANAGIVVVRGYPEDLREVAQYLDKIQNNLNREVILEAKILEVQLNDGYQAGINWNKFRFAQTGGNLASPIVDAGGFFSLNIGGNDFGAIINLLEQQGNVQTLSSPRISTINNQQAVIKVGKDDFFVTSVTSNQTPSNGTTTNSSSVGLTPFFSGITLDVTPQISKDGQIILHVHPSVSTVIDKTKEVTTGTDTNGKPVQLILPLAESTVRESDNIVRAQNGQIVVIGGLMQNNMSENLASTPWLSRIPFLGAVFRHTAQLSGKSELVILLRPVVVNNNVWPAQLESSSANFCRLDRGFHVGSRPEIFGTRGETEY